VEFKIRLFNKKDAYELSKVILSAVDNLAEEYPKTEYHLLRLQNASREILRSCRQMKIWVAMLDKRIIGTISLDNNRIRRFYVHPAFQQEGIGHMLIKTAVAFARKMHYKYVFCWALLTAVPGYKKLGFREGTMVYNPRIRMHERIMKLVLH
jgi:GNAT superfamily N-acetyltransferase